MENFFYTNIRSYRNSFEKISNRSCAKIVLHQIRIIEHSENKIIRQSRLSENEISPGLLQSNSQQTPALQEYQRYKPRATDHESILSFLCEIFAGFMLVEHETGALQVQPRSRNT